MTTHQEYLNEARILHSFLTKKCACMSDGRYQISQKQISKETGIKLSRLGRAIARLNSEGLITVDQDNSTSRPTPNFYSMAPSPYYFELLASYEYARQEAG